MVYSQTVCAEDMEAFDQLPSTIRQFVANSECPNITSQEILVIFHSFSTDVQATIDYLEPICNSSKAGKE